MLYLPHTKVVDSSEVTVAPGAAILAEGQALVRAPGAPAAGVMPSTGVAGEIFCGFAIVGLSAAPFMEGFDNKVETFVVPATGSVKLQFEPVSGQVFVADAETGVADTTFAVTGKTVSGLTAGATVKVGYRYAMTAVQQRARLGDVQPGGYSGLAVGQAGCAKRGVIYISEFDASKDWAAATAIKLGAAGQLTDQSGSGVTINAVVVALPSQDVPFLGIEFTAL